MAHFAKLDENNIVETVLVVDNDVLVNEKGVEDERLGVDFLARLTGHTKWVQTSYNNKFRNQYAGTGYSYDPEDDVFIAPKPYPSWTLDKATYRWVAPVAYPSDASPDKTYIWNEENKSWEVLVYN